MKKTFAMLLVTVMMLLCCVPAMAAEDMRLIVPFGAGGGTDALARKLADIIGQQTGINIIVENKTGGSGAVGMAEGAMAKPDGNTVTMTTVEVVLLPLAGLASFETMDLAPITRVNFDAAALIVGADNKANTLEEFVANSDENTIIAVSAFPTNYWLCGTMLAQQSGVNFNVVEDPNGAASEIQSLLGKQVDAIVCTMAEAAQYVKNGDFKFMAVADTVRNANYPEIPTFTECGYDIVVGTWRGFEVPKATPAEKIAELNEIFTNAYNSQDFQDFLATMGFGTGYLNCEDFKALKEAQIEQYGPVVGQFVK